MAGTETSPSMQAGETESPPNQVTPAAPVHRSNEVILAKCECCKLTEECTRAYIAQVREMHNGRWICGLCSEVVKDEIIRSEKRISAEEALNRHIKFYDKYRSNYPPSIPIDEFIAVMKQYLFKNTEVRSNPSSPMGKHGSGMAYTRSNSCFTTMDTQM